MNATDSDRRRPPILWPLGGLLVATAVLVVLQVDLIVARRLFNDASGNWFFERNRLLDVIDRVGPYAGIVVGVGGLVTFLLAFRVRRLEPARLPALFLALAAIVGPFLIVNALLKATWGRPRPNNLAEFGAEAEYHELWSRGDRPDVHKSFPSGHASIGFYLIAPAFLFYRRRPRLFAGLLAAGLGYGLLMSLSRVLQGSHFVTDVLWAAGIVYLTCALLYRLLEPERADDEHVAEESRASSGASSSTTLGVAA